MSQSRSPALTPTYAAKDEIVEAVAKYTECRWRVCPALPGALQPALRNWQALASAEPELGRRLTERVGNCNLGILTGVVSGVMAIEARGFEGDIALARLTSVCPELKGAWKFSTPDGRSVCLLAYDDSQTFFHPPRFAGLRIYADRDFLVMPPSVVAGGQCKWDTPPVGSCPPDASAELIGRLFGERRSEIDHEVAYEKHMEAASHLHEKAVMAATDQLVGDCDGKGVVAVLRSLLGLARDVHMRDADSAYLLENFAGALAIGKEYVVAAFNGRPPQKPAGLLKSEADQFEATWGYLNIDINRHDEAWDAANHISLALRALDIDQRLSALEGCGFPGARPHVVRDTSEIPRRALLYGNHFARGFVSTTHSSGGVGKTTLAIAEALAIATGRPLLGIAPTQRVKVFLWNGEDSLSEMEARIAAAIVHFAIEPDEIDGWLIYGSGREQELVIARVGAAGIIALEPVGGQLVDWILANSIGLVIVDPFVSSHRVPENDNGAIDLVAKEWARIAGEGNCAIELIHHTRKTLGDDVSAEDGRGAVALPNAARSVRAIRQMTEREAEQLDVDPEDRRAYVRQETVKANLAAARGWTWYHLLSVRLENGDDIQVIEPWSPPDPFAEATTADLLSVQQRIAAGRQPTGEPWRASIQAGDAWAGHAVADAFGLDLDRPRDRSRVRGLLAMWIKSRALSEVVRTYGTKGKSAPFIEVGNWVADSTSAINQGGKV